MPSLPPRPLSLPFRAAAHLAALAAALSLVGWLSGQDLLRADGQQRLAGLLFCAGAILCSHLRSRVLSRAVGRALALCGQALFLVGVVDVAPHVVRSLALAGIALGLLFAFASGDAFERAFGAAGACLALFALGAELGRGLLPFAIGFALVGSAAIARAVRRGAPRAWASGIGLAAVVALFVWPRACAGAGGLCLAAAVLATYGLRGVPAAVGAALLCQLPPGPWWVAGGFALAMGEERRVRELSAIGAVSLVWGMVAFERALPGSPLLHFASFAVLAIGTLWAQARLPFQLQLLQAWIAERRWLRRAAPLR